MTLVLETRVCSACQVEQPIDHYGYNRGRRRLKCRDCMKLSRLQYVEKNREQIQRKSREWRQKNKESEKVRYNAYIAEVKNKHLSGQLRAADTKNCSQCNTTKSGGEFQKDRTKKDGLRPYCLPCGRLLQQQAYQKRKKSNPQREKELTRRRNLRKLTGVTPEEVSTWLELQGGRCRCCDTDKPGARGWVVEHCHETRNIRGICCNRCNLRLGHMGDGLEEVVKNYTLLMQYLLLQPLKMKNIARNEEDDK